MLVEFGGRDLVIVKDFAASANDLYRAWTQELADWMGPSGISAPRVQTDLRPGGAYRIDMIFPEGTEYSWGGRYLELDPPSRLRFTVDFHGENGELDRSSPTEIVLEFEAMPAGTRMTFRQLPFPPGVDRKAHADGWVEAFDKLDAAVRLAAQLA